MTYKKKLIEVALPLAMINAESAREKSIRHGHPSTLHLWWARRPLAAARAVLWASLVDDPSAHPDMFPTEEDQQVERKRLFDILERLVPWEASNDARILGEARAEIERSCDGDLPKILDPFGGGGAIPLEALRLGLPTYTGDLNPVAVLIQRAMLEIPGRFAAQPPVHPDARASQSFWDGARGLAADVEAYGRWMQAEAKRRIGEYYPDVQLDDGTRASPIAWIWARTIRSPDPAWAEHVPLVKSWTIATRKSRGNLWIDPVVDTVTRSVSYRIREGGSVRPGTVGRGQATCIATGSLISGDYIKAEGLAGRLGARMMAIVAHSPGGRVYLPATDIDEERAAAATPEWRPTGSMPPAGQGLGLRVQAYGFAEWSSLFTSRQLLALTTFSDLLSVVYGRIEDDARGAGRSDSAIPLRDGGDGAKAYADAICTYLALAIDKCADYGSSWSTWVDQGEFVSNIFKQQAIPPNWDFAEANPLSESTGSWAGMVRWIAKVLEGPAIPSHGSAEVLNRDARSRVKEVGQCVVSTDPPYYDNVGYADLSDFYYVWLRRNLGSIWPEDTATLLTPKQDELISDPTRAGSRLAATEFFESGMREVFSAIAEVQDDRFPSSIFYAFKATESTDAGQTSTGWEVFLQGLLDAGAVITSTWPIRTERAGGVRNAGRNSLASSVVLSWRRRTDAAPMATRGDLISALRTEMDPAIRLLQTENIAPVDLAQSAIGPGIAVFSRYSKVVEADGSAMTVRTALGLINEILAEVLSGEESEFDADTRFALTWFEQFGHNPGPFGDADLLARAKDTTVAGVAQAGVVVSRDGKVRLVERRELGSTPE